MVEKLIRGGPGAAPEELCRGGQGRRDDEIEWSAVGCAIALVGGVLIVMIALLARSI